MGEWAGRRSTSFRPTSTDKCACLRSLSSNHLAIHFPISAKTGFSCSMLITVQQVKLQLLLLTMEEECRIQPRKRLNITVLLFVIYNLFLLVILYYFVLIVQYMRRLLSLFHICTHTNSNLSMHTHKHKSQVITTVSQKIQVVH